MKLPIAQVAEKHHRDGEIGQKLVGIQAGEMNQEAEMGPNGAAGRGARVWRRRRNHQLTNDLFPPTEIVGGVQGEKQPGKA